MRRKSGRPSLACEIAGGQVYAAQAGDRASGVDRVQARNLPGAVIPNLMNQNIKDEPALRYVLTDALQSVEPRGKELTLVVPDAAARVVLLDFDTLPDRKAEADAVVRFRLKKAFPFDVERASISYHAQPNGTTLKVIVAVMMSTVLSEYENVVRDSGFLPGVVLPSTLAALGNVEGDAPSMVVKVAEGSTTIAILSQGRLLFYRTLDHGSSGVPAETLADDIYPSAIFFQDMYGVPIERVYLSGVQDHQTVAAHLTKETSATVEEMLNPSFEQADFGTAGRSGMAGLLGALA